MGEEVRGGQREKFSEAGIFPRRETRCVSCQRCLDFLPFLSLPSVDRHYDVVIPTFSCFPGLHNTALYFKMFTLRYGSTNLPVCSRFLQV